MIEAIRVQVRQRCISRLCHFTPSRNLMHIATDPVGILASAHLRADDRAVLNATDAQRLDGFPHHVCCSIQYPNAWYFRKARKDERLFKDWVVLLISPHYLWLEGARFCPRNAASNFGSSVEEGLAAFEAMFAPQVIGARGNAYTRTASHPTWLPTDEQSEVLIPDRVAFKDVLGVAVADEAQAKREAVRLSQLQAALPPLLVIPDFFNPDLLSRQLRSGIVPAETPYLPGGAR